ncbi:MAG: hypothetical protein ACI9LM_002976 [Alteromonadaceae bacterium]|jgi:hypothetical protein
MSKTILFMMSFLLLFLGCSNGQPKTERNENPIAVSKVENTLSPEKVSANNPDIETLERLRLTEDRSNKRAELSKEHSHKRSMILNGEKFTLHAASFNQGSKVYNIQMREYGLVKGSIVVVSTQPMHVDELRSPMTKVVKIAKNTFRLTPEKTVELISFYKDLITSKRFSVVEMEIDYSPIKTTAEY